ncbi:MAG: MFS transporter, partial [Proteobacteria bacterium]|nr:MFS transporter [Pseudomonadota bacterium]
MTVPTLLLFTVINLLNYLDRYLLAALLPSVKDELALSHESGGALVSAFVIGYFIFSPVFGFLGDRVRRPLLMAIGVGLWSVATSATALVGAFGALMLTRVLVGVGEASFATIAPGYIKDRTDSPEQLNARLAVFYTAIPVGAALAYALSGILITHLPWRSIFLLA